MRLIRKCVMVLSLLVGLSLTGGAHAQTNLLVNGDFSLGTNGLEGWSLQFNTTDGTCASSCQQVAGAGTAPNTYAEFQYGAGLTTANLQQTFQTAAGQRYVLSFVYAAYGNDLSGAGRTLVLYLFSGDTQLTYFTYTAGPADPISFQDPVISFAGDGKLWTFVFQDASTTTGTPTTLDLTHVNLVAVPEPASMALVIVAFAGIGAVRSRRRS